MWCNNTASWWPDVPVVLAILLATVVMAILCWDVYQKERVSLRWRGGSALGGENDHSNRLSSQVFWQSCWYLMAFYLTWPPYLVLQFLWAADNYFTQYGLILSAGVLVPLQGFWNFFVYIRPRQFKRIRARAAKASSLFFARFQSSTSETGTSPTKTSDQPASSRKLALSPNDTGESGSADVKRPSEESALASETGNDLSY